MVIRNPCLKIAARISSLTIMHLECAFYFGADGRTRTGTARATNPSS